MPAHCNLVTSACSHLPALHPCVVAACLLLLVQMVTGSAVPLIVNLLGIHCTAVVYDINGREAEESQAILEGTKSTLEQ